MILWLFVSKIPIDFLSCFTYARMLKFSLSVSCFRFSKLPFPDYHFLFVANYRWMTVWWYPTRRRVSSKGADPLHTVACYISDLFFTIIIRMRSSDVISRCFLHSDCLEPSALVNWPLIHPHFNMSYFSSFSSANLSARPHWSGAGKIILSPRMWLTK